MKFVQRLNRNLEEEEMVRSNGTSSKTKLFTGKPKAGEFKSERGNLEGHSRKRVIGEEREA